jgi:hypothetical protein
MLLHQQNGIYPVIGAFDVTLTYSPTMVTTQSASFSGFLGDLTLGEAVGAADLSQPGLVNMFEFSLLSGVQLRQLQQNAPKTKTTRLVPLGTINFLAVNGSSAVDFLHWTVSDDQGNTLPVTVRNGFVAATPEPSSVVLLSLATALAVTRLRLRRREGWPKITRSRVPLFPYRG